MLLVFRCNLFARAFYKYEYRFAFSCYNQCASCGTLFVYMRDIEPLLNAPICEEDIAVLIARGHLYPNVDKWMTSR